MTPITRPRGPLPARVYWTRRLLVLVVALGLVFGVARLLGGGGSGGAGPSARPVAADPTSTPTMSTPTLSTPTAPSPTRTPRSAGPTPTPSMTGAAGSTAPSTVLAAPSGTCENSDVAVIPSVAGPAYAGRPVILTLTLTTKVAPACTWVVSPDNLVMKVTSGDSRFWSTQDCPSTVPTQQVVVRSAVPTKVSMAWNGLRSDADCSRSTSWADPGYYHVVAAAFGAEPTDVQFRLRTPVRKTITASPTPSAQATRTPRRR